MLKANRNSYSFCLLLCNHKLEIKFIMLNLNGGTLLIIPCYSKIDAPKIAEEVSKYFDENPNLEVTNFEQDCWTNKNDIKNFISKITNEQLSVDEDDSAQDKKPFFLKKLYDDAPIGGKITLISAAATIIVATVNFLAKKW